MTSYSLITQIGRDAPIHNNRFVDDRRWKRLYCKRYSIHCKSQAIKSINRSRDLQEYLGACVDFFFEDFLSRDFQKFVEGQPRDTIAKRSAKDGVLDKCVCKRPPTSKDPPGNPRLGMSQMIVDRMDER